MSLKLAVAFPLVGRFVPPELAIAMGCLQYPMNCNHAFLSVKGRPRGEARTELVKLAQHFGSEYILFIDDDTVPPANTPRLLIRELDQDPEAAVCGGIYTSRSEKPYEPMVFMQEGGGPFWRWQYGKIFQCSSLGTGCMLIRMSVFDEIPEPWFLDINDKSEVPDTGLYSESPIEPLGFTMTDDIYFCRKVRQAGHKILAHGGVLPVHFNADGTGAVLDRKSFPMRNVEQVWYDAILPRGDNYLEHTGDGLPDGWLTIPEAGRLAKEVKDCKVLEFGSYKGRSAVVMANTASQIICVDPHGGDFATGESDTLGEFLANTAPYPNITPIVGLSRDVSTLFADQSFDVVYIDADHSFAGASHDFELAKRLGKRILCHDWNKFQVTEAATACQLTPLWVENTLAELIVKDTKENNV